MKRNNIIVLLTIAALLITIIHVPISAQAPTEVYTSFSSGNFNHSGSGTAESPYNLFEDALSAVAEGGTIYIGAGGAFINYVETDSAPLEITKNVTVAAAPGLGFRPMLSYRRAGMILGADVTFQNIILSFANGFRPIICANGYTLTLDNTSSCPQMTRLIHLSGGGMNGYSNIASGPHSQIIVKGKEAVFGNIYAGSINGSFDKNVDIILENVPGQNIGDIYSCGAKEGYYNAENFMDPNNEPHFPVADHEKYPVNGSVSIELNNTGVKTVYGTTGGGDKTSVSVSTEYLYSCSLNDVESVTLKKGAFKPNFINNGVNISVCKDAVFNIADIGNFSVNDFHGGGILAMGYSGMLTINGECTGETEFRTDGGSQYNSYIVQPEHMYIKTALGDGIFTFKPCYLQRDMTLDKHADGWYTSAQPENEATVLKDFKFESDVVFVTETEINNNGVNIDIVSEFTENSPYKELSFIPFDYELAYKGKCFYTESELYEEDYYEGNFRDLNISFMPANEDSIFVSNMSNTYGLLDRIEAGIYDVDITVPTETGSITRTLRLVVSEDNAQKEDFIVTDTNGRINVTYINLTDNNIEDAVMLAAAYNNGVMKKLEISDKSVSVEKDKLQSFQFDMSDTEYDKIKLFIWNGLHDMKPLSSKIVDLKI